MADTAADDDHDRVPCRPHVHPNIIHIHADAGAGHVCVHFQFDMRVMKRNAHRGSDLSRLSLDHHVVEGLTSFAVVINDDLVPVGVLPSGGRHYRLEILLMPVVLEDAPHVSSGPNRRTALNLSKDHFGKEVGPIAGAEVHEVLNATCAIKFRANAHAGGQHYVGLPVIAGDDTDVL